MGTEGHFSFVKFSHRIKAAQEPNRCYYGDNECNAVRGMVALEQLCHLCIGRQVREKPYDNEGKTIVCPVVYDSWDDASSAAVKPSEQQTYEKSVRHLCWIEMDE